METCEHEIPSHPEDPTLEIQSDLTDNIESSENFQKFIYQLFEKNGILNDLRAYLRGHIVNVLKRAQTGEVPTCQKNFTQRLELTHQALNILIAEYLLQMDFSYTLSVFLSEIPLANMVFGFAKTLLQCGGDITREIRFKETDVWSIVNYLGIICDSEHVSNIMDMYKSEEAIPLMMCLLKYVPMYKKSSHCIDKGHVSEESHSLSSESTSTLDDRVKDKCKHVSGCKVCRNKIMKMKGNYKKKKRTLAKNVQESIPTPLKMENVMKKISAVERSVLNDMFEELKAVYEAEAVMVRSEEERRMKSTLAHHARQLQKHHEEMREALMAREAELALRVQHKKRFLWALTRALRARHARLASALRAVRREASRLTDKEESLKTQQIEAENVLRSRAEEMRTQISKELIVLEEHLECMKRDRDSMSRERCELEHLRNIDKNSKVNVNDENDVAPPYDLLKNELVILKRYLQSTKLEPKSVIETSTLTEINDVTSRISVVLNNEDSERNLCRDEDRGRTPNLVVNDFKKLKNVNFSQSNLDELYRERSRERSRSSASSDAGDRSVDRDCDRDRSVDRNRVQMQQLRDENERLRAFARQQREHIDQLSSQQARLQAELSVRAAHAPAPAPAPVPVPAPRRDLHAVPGVYPSNSLGWRLGAGEELSLFSNARPRVLLPGDAVPFIGVLQDRHTDSRRHLINQWRTLRRRASPIGAGARLRNASPSTQREPPSSAVPGLGMPREMATSQFAADTDERGFEPVYKLDEHKLRFNAFQSIPCKIERSVPVHFEAHLHREKSPKSVRKEAKEKLRSKPAAEHPRAPSPAAAVREARLRLRKLEVEAEAVERAYRHFRSERPAAVLTGHGPGAGADIKRSTSLQKLDDHVAETSQTQKDTKLNVDSYLSEYQNAFDTHYSNRNITAKKIRPIPDIYSPDFSENTKQTKVRQQNFLEKPLAEFRKLYHAQKQRPVVIIDDIQTAETPKTSASLPTNNVESNDTATNENNNEIQLDAREDLVKPMTKQAELEILKQNIDNIYNLHESPSEIKDKPVDIKPSETLEIAIDAKNMLKVEIEAVSKFEEIMKSESQDVLVVVQNGVDTRQSLTLSESDGEAPKLCPNITILISPKRSCPQPDEEIRVEGKTSSPDRSGRRSLSPEQEARLTRNDVLDAIFHADTMKESSSFEIGVGATRDLVEDATSDVEQDYPDDFSADVDNYRSEENQISHPKTSEDESFWES